MELKANFDITEAAMKISMDNYTSYWLHVIDS